MLGLHNAQSDVSQHFTAGQLCVALGLDQQSSVKEQLQQPVQRSLRVALISTQVPTKVSGLDHGFPSALTGSSSARLDTLALSTRALSFNSCNALALKCSSETGTDNINSAPGGH